jgi:serine/threonine protein kinase
MADRVGEQFGKYKLTKLLGRGGFADVYLGQHVTLGTLVAIKVLHTRLSPDDLASFLKEAQTIARLAEHPHILRVLDFDDGGGLPYLVMDYAPNGTLRSKYPAGTRVPLETVVGYVQQVADGLQFAHEQQPPIVHRDIKPENMLLGRQGEIRLSDFGIAVTVTQYINPHAPSGTAAYMAPELFNGEVHRASDQYSLGVVVYEWLCGTRPFPGPGYLQYGHQHVNNPAPALRSKAPDLPPAVEEVVMTALEKDPKARFGSVKAFATALSQASLLTQPSQISEPDTPASQPTTPQLAPPISEPPPATPESPLGKAGPAPTAPSSTWQQDIFSAPQESIHPPAPPKPKLAIKQRLTARNILVGLLLLVVLAGGGVGLSLVGKKSENSTRTPTVRLIDTPTFMPPASDISGMWAGPVSYGDAQVETDSYDLSLSGSLISGIGNSSTTGAHFLITGTINRYYIILNIHIVENNCDGREELQLSADYNSMSGNLESGCNGRTYTITLTRK